MPTNTKDNEITVQINESATRQTVTADLQKILSQIKGLKVKISNANLDKDAIKMLQTQLSSLKTTIDISEIYFSQSHMRKVVQQISRALSKEIKRTSKLSVSPVSFSVDTSGLTAELAEIKESLNKCLNQFSNTADTVKKSDVSSKAFNNIFNTCNRISDLFNKKKSLSSTIISYVQDSVNKVINLDSAMSDLKNNSNMTSQELRKFYFSANDIAKKTGTTTENIIKQANALSRLGYTSKEAASHMAEYAASFKLVSPGLDIGVAGSALANTMKAYGYRENDAHKIMSMINTAGQSLNASNADIAKVLAISSGEMAKSGNSLADTLSLGGAAAGITKDADAVGKTLPTDTVMCR